MWDRGQHDARDVRKSILFEFVYLLNFILGCTTIIGNSKSAMINEIRPDRMQISYFYSGIVRTNKKRRQILVHDVARSSIRVLNVNHEPRIWHTERPAPSYHYNKYSQSRSKTGSEPRQINTKKDCCELLSRCEEWIKSNGVG